jgi:uncharacterized pyridoxal phosphate-containing UPF0001 family protein
LAYGPTFGFRKPISYAGNQALEEYAMSVKEEQLLQLLGLMARSMTHMTASITAMAFEQLRSQDAALQNSAKRMIERMQAINEELDQQWELVGQLTGQRDQEALVEELDISSVRVHREAEAS